MKHLHPGAKWLFRMAGYVTVFFLWIFIGVYVSVALAYFNMWLAIISLILTLTLAIALGEIYARMSYNRWLYELGKESLKLERGIIWKKYSNIPYQRVQNVDIHRGVIARMLGFSTVDIQTAGMHMSYGRYGSRARSEGHIPAVSIQEAEDIRELLMKKIGKRHGM
ncbi:hypothetical protein CMI46_00360 [Candidatus Pacearchaeota archaeon]|nr:hypothetical protein [Candidatus Pacearchaeota archaeon]|tara:strand:- start:30087 stop:30584 length:498 start_codon:yes stop_codon:yes gene_type:complete